MAQRRGTSGRSRRAGARDAAAERWLLLLGIAAALAIVVGVLGPRPRAPEPAVRMTMAQARLSNAAVPIERAQAARAAPFRFAGGPAGRAQAVDCLATAALYEAGEDRAGQAAVIQVVLNRVRAPGFPRTVCGVVYQGHERATGCQFSFACDRSVSRRPEHEGWAAARRAARRALAGHVFAPVGRATHYHADWTVPWWRGSVVKVAQVGPHLFYVRPGPARAVPR